MKSGISLLLLLSLSLVLAVDRNKFKRCDQSGFCKRCRAVQPGSSQYEVEPDTLHVSPTSLDTLVVNNNNGVKFKLSIIGLVMKEAKKAPKGEVEAKLAPSSVTTH